MSCASPQPPDTPGAESPGGEPAPAITRWEHLRPRLVFAIRAGVVCTLLAAVFVIVRAAEMRRRVDPRHTVHLARWQVLHSASFATAESILALRSAAGLTGRTIRLHDRAAVSDLVATLEALPEVRTVHAVRRRFPAEFDVEIELRRPYALIAAPSGAGDAGPNGDFAICDEEGVVIAHGSGARPVVDGRPLPWVTGAEGPLTAPGATVSADIRAALDLLGELSQWKQPTERRHLAMLDEIDIGNFGGRVDRARPEILLRAAPLVTGTPRPTACVVEWGRPDARRGEPTFERKTRHLLRALVADPALVSLDRVLVAYRDLRVVPREHDGTWLPPLGLVASRGP